MNLKRANNILKRHLQLSAFIYAIFGSGTICWSNSPFFKLTFILRAIQATFIMQRIQKYIFIIILSSRYWRDKLYIWIWLAVILFQVMKMFAMFISGLREQNLISSVANDLVKIDKTILEFSMRKNRKSLLYSYKLYFIDAIGCIFFISYQIMKYMEKNVSSGLVDILFFVKAICILMHSSFCKYVFITSTLLKNVNEQFCLMKNFYLSQDRTIQTIRIFTIQHRLIINVWGKLMQYYEPYLFFHISNIFLDVIYFIKKFYMYIDQNESATNFQVWHVFIGALWSFYEILSICILCTKVAVEVSWKLYIAVEWFSIKKNFFFLNEKTLKRQQWKKSKISFLKILKIFSENFTKNNLIFQ